MKKDRTCKYCNVTFTDCEGKLFSNHVQWCDKNLDIDRSAIHIKQLAIAKSRSIPENNYTKTCPKCNVSFNVTCKPHHLNNQKYCPTYCSRKCANARNHSDVVKDKIRKSTIDYISIHGVNGGNKASVRVNRSCEYCSTLFFPKRKTSKCCSRTCSSKLKRSNKNISVMGDLSTYRRFCTFRFALNAYPLEFDFDLIRKYGWYKAINRGNNLTGVTRDHMVSIRYGFDNGISPDIISHPANCTLMQHGLNSSKCSGCTLTVDQLMTRITEWETKYGKFVPLDWSKCKKLDN